jgi:hypothetical protein
MTEKIVDVIIAGGCSAGLYSKVWFNTPSQTMFARSAPAQMTQRLQNVGIKPKNPPARGRV